MSHTPFRVRRLTPDDVDPFRTLRLEGLRLFPDAFGSAYEDEIQFPNERWISWLISANVFGGFEGDQLCGCASLSPGRGAKHAHTGELGAVYVAPATRKRGLGRQLIDAAHSAASGRFLRIILTVNAANKTAVNLYLRHGYTVYGRLNGSLFANGIYHDELLMVHEILQNSN